MEEVSASKDSYTNKWIKERLLGKYSEHVSFHSLGVGKDILIIFESTAYHLLEQNYTRDANHNLQSEDEPMYKHIGKAIKNEIRNMKQPNELQNMDYLNSWVPPTLKNLLGILIPNELKRVSIAHAIISASKKSLLSPLLFGVGVQLARSFGSKWLNNHLS